MKKSLKVGIGGTLATAALLFGAAPAMAATTPPDNGGVSVVDEPDTSGLNNVWTFAPLGVPVLGLVQSVVEVPGKLLPSGGGGY